MISVPICGKLRAKTAVDAVISPSYDPEAATAEHRRHGLLVVVFQMLIQPNQRSSLGIFHHLRGVSRQAGPLCQVDK